ncbi:hypothetical protein BAE44_0009423 [Dichanthelium oligosanthes]|uniref:Gamma-interferon-inducible lysosomal thiol reductase n=1 Tax=Dichanthelium oligosanthes TaxID=888268 RepID=A0A1E5VWR3_9POAL|nr:hypothetical protein BAE44_0009423 [Dichanthelium oligosanthes]
MIAQRRLLPLPAGVLLLLAAGALLPPQSLAAAEGEKVSLELYYESLCPYCSRFIVNRLAGIFEDGLIDAVDLRLVPYGNARVGSNGDISCQSGSCLWGRPHVSQNASPCATIFLLAALSTKVIAADDALLAKHH